MITRKTKYTPEEMVSVPDELLQTLKFAAHDLAYYATDRSRDYFPRKKRYWLDMGIKIQQLYEAIEEFDTWETFDHADKRKNDPQPLSTD